MKSTAKCGGHSGNDGRGGPTNSELAQRHHDPWALTGRDSSRTIDVGWKLG
jgi:hypothetical protein